MKKYLLLLLLAATTAFAADGQFQTLKKTAGGGLTAVFSGGSSSQISPNDYLSSQVSGGATSAADTWTSATGSITLPPGRWLLGYDITLLIQNIDANVGVNGSAVIFNGSSNLDETIAFINSPVLTIAANDGYRIPMSRRTVVSVSSSTTFSMRTRSGYASTGTANDATVSIVGTSITGTMTNPDNSSLLWAIRLGNSF